ncbi:MAG: MFS transporter [Eubacteriales bacterium]|nr:MFS transporter [Eubacteriales bacterium]
MATTRNYLPLVDKIGYGAGNLGAGVAMQVINSYLVFFATAILGIPGSLAGLAIGISVFWDAVTDPLMGYFSDITRSQRFGRRHLYLILGSLGIAATVYLVWGINTDHSTPVKFGLMLLFIIMFKTAMTVYVTPYTALGAELSPDYNERTAIQGIKTIFFLIGLALVSVAGMSLFFAPTAEYPIGQLNPQAYRRIGAAAAGVVIVSAATGYLATKKYIRHLNAQHIEQPSGTIGQLLLASLKSTFANAPFRAAANSYLFNNMAAVLISTIGLHVFTYTFHLTNHQIALVYGLQLLLSIVSQPFWAMISRRLDKKPAMNLGLFVCGMGSFIFAVMVIWHRLIPGNFVVFIPYAMLTGFGTGALFTLPLSMVSDTIDLDELKTGKRAEGFYFGSMTLYYKTSQALAIFLIGIVLDLIRFDATLPKQSTVTAMGLGLLLGLGSLLSFGLSSFSLRNYTLTEKAVLQIQDEIRVRGQQ